MVERQALTRVRGGGVSVPKPSPHVGQPHLISSVTPNAQHGADNPTFRVELPDGRELQR